MVKRKKYLQKWRETNKESIKNAAKEYYIVHRESMLENMRVHRKNKKKIYAVTQKIWAEKNKKYISQKYKEWYEKNKTEYNKKRREQYQKNPPAWSTYEHRKEYLKKWQRDKRKKDLLYRLNSNISRRIRKDLKHFNLTKKESTQEILQYTMKELKTHIQKQFKAGMSWKNMGTVWEIDHSTPLSWGCSKDDMYKLWGLSNLVPLFKSDNRKKQDLYSGNLTNTFSILGR